MKRSRPFARPGWPTIELARTSISCTRRLATRDRQILGVEQMLVHLLAARFDVVADADARACSLRRRAQIDGHEAIDVGDRERRAGLGARYLDDIALEETVVQAALVRLVPLSSLLARESPGRILGLTSDRDLADQIRRRRWRLGWDHRRRGFGDQYGHRG